MDAFAYRLIRDLLNETGELALPLRRAMRSHPHLNSFLLAMGWNLPEALACDLPAVRTHVDSIIGSLRGVRAAIGAGDETAVALAARDALKNIVDRARPLYDLVMAVRPVPVKDAVIEAFVEDIVLHLLTLHLARRSPAGFQLAIVAGLVRPERPPPLYASPPDGRLLRLPIERVVLRPQTFIVAGLNPALAFLSGLHNPVTLLEDLRTRLETEARRLAETLGPRGLQGMELRLEPTGVRVAGGPLPRPEAGGAAIRLPLAPSGSAVLEIGATGWGVSWGPDLAPEGVLTLFDAHGVRLTIPSRPKGPGAVTGMTLSQPGNALQLDLVGALALELPANILTGANGDAVTASGRVHVAWRQGGTPTIELEEARVQGRFHLGGAGGLLIEDAEVVIGHASFPFAAPTLARPLPFDVSLSGALVLEGGDFRLQVEASYAAGYWSLRSSGDVRFPNGVVLRPVAARPIFELKAAPVDGVYQLAAAGEILFPQDTSSSAIAAQGELVLGMQGGAPSLRSFRCSGEARNWALGDGLQIDRLAVTLSYEPGRFAAAVAAAIPLADGFVLEVLDRAPPSLAGLSPAMGFTITDAAGVLTATVAGGIRLTFPAGVLTDADSPDPVTAEAAGVLTLSSDPGTKPSLSNISFALKARRLRLGDGSGLILENAAITAANMDRLLALGAAPFPTLTLAGDVICPIEMSTGQLKLSLKGAQFTFKRPDRLPDFAFTENGHLGVENATPQGFPLEVSHASISTEAAGALPDVLRPSNLRIELGVALSAAFADMAGAIAGVDRVTAEIKNGRPHITLHGIKFGVEDLTIPPMRFSGALGVHNLADPANVQLEGVLGGSMQGATVKALVALKLDQGRPMPLGVCLDVNLGPSGISLAYGFTLQGASGGLSFANTNADPSAFTTYSDEGRRVREASRAVSRGGRTPAARPGPSAGCNCDCPPAAMNILCQPHPNQDLYPGRAILKFSAIEEDMWAVLRVPDGSGGTTTLGELLDKADERIRAEIARGAPGFDGRAAGAALARQVAASLKSAVAAFIPSLDPDAIRPQPPAEMRAGFRQLAEIYRNPAEYWVEETVARLGAELGEKLAAIASGGALPPLRQLVAAQLYRGINCPDTTLQVTGSFSYVGVSSFAYVTGGVNVSTAGSMGVLGVLTVFGVPFGQLRAFVTATGASGDLDPSLCGDLAFEFGPLRLGQLCLEYKIPGAVTNFADALARFGNRISKPLVRKVLDRMDRADRPFSKRAGFDIDANLAGSLGALQAGEAAQFIASLFSEPNLTEAEARSAATFAAELARDLWNGFAPQISLCGEVAPEVFGVRLAKLAQVKSTITKDRMSAEFAFSPLYLLGRVFPIADLFSGADSAAMGVALSFPRLETLAAEGLVAHLSGRETFEAVLERGVSRALQETTLTFSYQLFPLGMRLADAQGRVVLPYLTPHPAAQGAAWRNPDDAPRGGATARPTRRQALFAALDAQRLADINWHGRIGEVVSPPPGEELLLQRDYFPHGGMIGAGKLLVPRLLWDAAPLELLHEGLQTDDWGVRIRTLITLVKDWVLATREAGTLAFYVPAPVPPAALINRPDPPMRDLAAAMRQLDPSILAADGSLQAGPSYPLHLAFFEGRLHGKVMGMHVGDADIYFRPPAAPGGASEMRIRAKLAEDPRLAKWLQAADAELVITHSDSAAGIALQDRQSLEERFGLMLQRLQAGQAAMGTGPQPSAATRALADSATRALATYLPRAWLAGTVAVRTPPELAPWLGSASAQAELRAYSPFFDTQAAGGTALDRVRRHGGIWLSMEVRFRFGELLRCTTRAEGSLELPEAVAQPARFRGEAAVSAVDAFTFAGAAVRMGAATLAFDTAAPAGMPVLALRGETGPLAFGPVRVEPAAPASKLSVELQAHRDAAGKADLALTIAPAQLRLPAVDAASVIELLPDEGQVRLRLGTDGGSARVRAPAGLRLLGPGGAAVLELRGPVSGVISLSGVVPTLTATLAKGLAATLLPGDPQLRTELSLPAETALTVRGDGAFSLSTVLPPLRLGSGLFAIHGEAGAQVPVPVTITDREVRLAGQAKLSVQAEGAARATAVLDALLLSAGRIEARGSGLALKLPGLLESTTSAFILARSGTDCELQLPKTELRFAALPGLVERWSVRLRPGALEADLIAGATASIRFGTRLSISAATWQVRGSSTQLSLRASAPQVSLLGQQVRATQQVAIAVASASSGPSAQAEIALAGDMRLLADVAELSPSSARLAWSPAGGVVTIAGRMRALRRLDGSQGWLVDRTVTLALAQDRFEAQGWGAAMQLFGKAGLTLTGEVGLGFDGQFFLGMRNLSAVCLGVPLAPVAAGPIRADGGLTVEWNSSANQAIGPFKLTPSRFRLSLKTTSAHVEMRLVAPKLSVAGSQGWPSAQRTLPDLVLAWTAGAPSSSALPVELAGNDSPVKSAALVQYRITGPKVRTSIQTAGGALSPGPLTLEGTLSVWTADKNPVSNQPWASATVSLSRTIAADGQVVIPLPRLDPGADPLGHSREECRRRAKGSIPLPEIKAKPPRLAPQPVWDVYNRSVEAYNAARDKLAEAETLCDASFPKAPSAMPPKDLPAVRIKDLFSFKP